MFLMYENSHSFIHSFARAQLTEDILIANVEA